MSSSERITEAELARSRKARDIARNWLQAETTRLELAGLDPALSEGTPGTRMRPSKYGRPSPLDRVREARVSGLEIREFEKGLSESGNGANSNSKPVQLDPNTVIQAKATIVNALAANHSPEQIAVYLEKISPFLDTAMLAGSDPLAQSLLYAKVMSSNNQQPLTLKDVIELVGIVNQSKPQQTQTDPASVMNAAGNLFRTGVETARGRNDGVDMSQVLAMQQQSHDKMLQAQQEHFKELRELQQQQPTLLDSLKQYRELQGLIGTTPDRPEVAMKKLDLQAAAEQREHEYRLESAKEKRQAELIRGITGGIGKALETPIIRELGKKAASAIPGAAPIVGAVTAAAASATKQALEEPLEERFSLDCAGCGTRYEFSRKQITLIQDGTGKWSCPKCGYTYDVGSQMDQKTDGPKGA